MKTITLPDALNLNTSKTIHVYNYKSFQDISKQQIILEKNTFSFLQKGTKEVFFDNSSYAIDNTQFLLMKSGHCLMTEKTAKITENYNSVLLFFSNEDVLNFIRKFELKAINSNTYYPAAYSFSYDSFIKTFVKSLLDISKLSTSIQKKILKTKFEEIMLYLIEFNGVDFLYTFVNETNNLTLNFIETIENNQLNKLTVKELAFLSNMSISTFKREFEKHFHSSPSKWFQEKRLEHAAHLLKNRNKRPSDIFEEVGYESLSNFTQAFKLKFKVTPKQYQLN